MNQRIGWLAEVVRVLAGVRGGDREARRRRIDVVAPVNRAHSINLGSRGSHQIIVRRQHAPISQKRGDRTATSDGGHE
jgi:hypothetical protein